MNEVSIERLRELFYFNPEIGTLIWKAKGGPANNPHFALQPAGGIDGKGYLQTHVGGKLVLNHRIAWAMFHGAWPDGHIDHINRVKTDNRISNLRIASNSENLRNANRPKNNTSGVRGVSWYKRSGKWQAYITADGKKHCLGRFANKDDAHLVRLVAEHVYWSGIHHLGPDETTGEEAQIQA